VLIDVHRRARLGILDREFVSQHAHRCAELKALNKFAQALEYPRYVNSTSLQRRFACAFHPEFCNAAERLVRRRMLHNDMRTAWLVVSVRSGRLTVPLLLSAFGALVCHAQL